jgi:hypothetical protein
MECLAPRLMGCVAPCRILIFAKAPAAGAVKTRLIPRTGAAGAAQFAQRMLRFTCAEALAVPGARAELCTSPDPGDAAWRGRIPAGVETSDQGSGELGERLARATKRAIDAGESAILIGSDCPALERKRLKSAVDALQEVDAFIHPALDGGYALLALRRFSPDLFSGIAWSTSAVAEETLKRIHSLGWSYAVGEKLRDIDEPADYDAWLAEQGGC